MQRQRSIKAVSNYTFKMLLAVCLVVSLAPSIALADTTVGVSVEQSAPINETVSLDKGSESATDPSTPNTDTSGDPTPTQITTEVSLGTPDATSDTLLTDGLTYQLNHTTTTATLTGYYGKAPEGDLVIPSTVTDGKTTYTLKFAGGGTF
ncbi:MAG: hypothetical protein RR619_03715 [Raoultibacter sp.]